MMNNKHPCTCVCHALGPGNSVMRTLGLDADFAQVLTREERIAGPEGMANAGAHQTVNMLDW
jgi:hypothetical protein